MLGRPDCVTGAQTLLSYGFPCVVLNLGTDTNEVFKRSVLDKERTQPGGYDCLLFAARTAKPLFDNQRGPLPSHDI